MPRPNWFLAFPFDGRFVDELTNVPPCVRRFPGEDVHLTLSFFGGCGEDKARAALAVLDALLVDDAPAPIDVSLGDVVPMGGSKRDYTALSALLADGREETEACIARLRDPLHQAATGRVEKRPPKAHVTIARPKLRPKDADRVCGLEWAKSLDLRQVRGRLDRIALYTWHERRPARLFRIVAERKLG
jgi:RNA 2',3'-cyclic 3'-phosphodiesterase